MTARAGIVVTGTEVLSGIIADANGPWLSEELRRRGVDSAHISVVGDRREDLRAVLDFLAGAGMDLIVTSGGLGPTADDLTAEVVAEFAGRPMALDAELEERIRAIVVRLRPGGLADTAAMRAGTRKQAMVPAEATILEPVGTAPGLVVPPAPGRAVPTVLVLPGPPGELQPMWAAALATPPVQAALRRADPYERGMLRLFGMAESELAGSLRDMEREGVPLGGLEVTTCLRRGEIEIATLYHPRAAGAYARFRDAVRARHGGALFSENGSTVDEQVAALLAGPPARSIATAESCTGGLLAARLTERPGSSAYVKGGIVVYEDAAKTALAGVPAELIAAHGAVSAEVAAALADGARASLGADVGVGITGIAGPGGGSPAKPVGTVHVSVASAAAREDRQLLVPGGRREVRDRTTTVAMHLLRRLLSGAA